MAATKAELTVKVITRKDQSRANTQNDYSLSERPRKFLLTQSQMEQISGTDVTPPGVCCNHLSCYKKTIQQQTTLRFLERGQ